MQDSYEDFVEKGAENWANASHEVQFLRKITRQLAWMDKNMQRISHDIARYLGEKKDG